MTRRRHRWFRTMAAVLWCAAVAVLPGRPVLAQPTADPPAPADGTPAQAPEAADVVVVLPAALFDALSPPQPGTPAHDRLHQTAEEALAGTEPAAFNDEGPVAGGELPPPAERALRESSRLLEEARHFEALQALADAERLAPDHPRVVRAVGLAQVLSGNVVRGEAYLARAAAMDPADAGVRVLLTRLALDRNDWSRALSIAAAIEQANALADVPAPDAVAFGTYARAVALDRLGYADAAAARYQAFLAADDVVDDTTVMGRELYIARQRGGDCLVRVGDLAVRAGRPEQALPAYEQAAERGTTDPAGLASRLAYAALVLNQPAAAANHAVRFLASAEASEAHAELARYLAQHGVDPATLEALLAEAQRDAPPGHLAVVAARAALVPQGEAVAMIDDWLGNQPASLALFRRATHLIRSGGGPDDPAALAQAVGLTAQAMRRHPDQADDYADALLGMSPDPVAMIRALRLPELAATDQPMTLRLIAAAYRYAGRDADALATLDRANALQPGDPATTLALARVLIRLAHEDPAYDDRAAQLLGPPRADEPWDRFITQIDLLRINGQLRDAQRLLRERLARNSGDLDLLLLEIRVRLEAANTSPAVQSLEQLLDRYPREERLYTDAIAFASFVSGSDRDQAIYRAFYARLRSRLERNLPDSRIARLVNARVYVIGDERRAPQPRLALPLLEDLAADYPDDAAVLVTLLQAYQAVGDTELADALWLRLNPLRAAGLARTLGLIRFYHLRGDTNRAGVLAREALELEAEGVMPGPAITGDQAALLLNYAAAVTDDAATEPYYLAMIRRFPDSALLNNALGYRWAQAGRELLSAEAMVRRAIEQEGEVSSYLDSLGWVLYKMGRYAHAEAMLRLAIAKLREERRAQRRTLGGVSMAIFCDHLGDALYRQGEVAAAVRQWVIARDEQIDPVDAALDPEGATVVERCAAKVQAVTEGAEPAVADAPGEPAFGAGGHPAERAP